MNTSPATTVNHRHLPGGGTATIVTVVDLDSVERGVQLTVPDEPLTANQLLDLADQLVGLARELRTGGTA